MFNRRNSSESANVLPTHREYLVEKRLIFLSLGTRIPFLDTLLDIRNCCYVRNIVVCMSVNITI